jgi:hypothetical protein
MHAFFKSTMALLLIATGLQAQEGEAGRLIAGELKMSFPSIYFKHNSTDYAGMPYTADSCFKYIANHFDKNINSLVIWRDSTETEDLTRKRIKKLKAGLAKYIRTNKPEIHSMGGQQKISRQTIAMTTDSLKISYLLSLNSVFDFSKTLLPKDDSPSALSHLYRPKIWCWSCWKSGFHMDKKSRNLRKTARMSKERASKADEKR